MKLYTVFMNNKEEIMVGLEDDNSVYLLKDLGLEFADMNELICKMTDEQMQGLYEMAAIGINEKAYNIEELELMSPIVRPRQDVICLGINYDEHAKEAGMYSEEAFGGERPYTIYFSKRVNKATGPKEGIPSYEGIVDSLDYESELGVILKKDVKGISKEEALDAVFGYTVINDVSARNLQTRHKQWYVGKSMDGFTPMGPCIVTADEIEDIKEKINGLRELGRKCIIRSIASRSRV